MDIPSRKEFRKGCKEFEKHEKRDSMYKVATFLLGYFWSEPSEMADGLGVLLLTWNQAFYRYGAFDFDKLERCIRGNFQRIKSFANRDISSLSSSDEDDIKHLFAEFRQALQIDSGKLKGRKSPVAVAKTLHLLAPMFFPLWDDKIARVYRCSYYKNPAEKYVSFCKITKTIADKVKGYIKIKDQIFRQEKKLKKAPGKKPIKTLIKLIDEYNYSKYTKGWI